MSLKCSLSDKDYNVNSHPKLVRAVVGLARIEGNAEQVFARSEAQQAEQKLVRWHFVLADLLQG